MQEKVQTEKENTSVVSNILATGTSSDGIRVPPGMKPEDYTYQCDRCDRHALWEDFAYIGAPERANISRHPLKPFVYICNNCATPEEIERWQD